MKRKERERLKQVKGASTEAAKEGDASKTRFKVGLVYRRIKVVTVYADDPQEAVGLVLSGEYGRDAGFEGDPKLFEAAAIPFDAPHSLTDVVQHRYEAAMQALQNSQKSNVLVPGPGPGEKMTKGGIILAK